MNSLWCRSWPGLCLALSFADCNKGHMPQPQQQAQHIKPDVCRHCNNLNIARVEAFNDDNLSLCRSQARTVVAVAVLRTVTGVTYVTNGCHMQTLHLGEGSYFASTGSSVNIPCFPSELWTLNR
jgi:hypothetical protein